MTFEHRLDSLAGTCIGLVNDIRVDRPAAHRTLGAMSRLEVEQVACVLAAMVDPQMNWPVMAWWRLDLVPAQRDQEKVA